MRVCRTCKMEKALKEFYGYARGVFLDCIPCVLDDRRRTNYGLSREQFEALIVGQGGRCAICRTDKPGGKGTWRVDHDHSCCSGAKSCGQCVRGLLCNNCNRAIGLMADDTTRLESAVRYLKREAC